MSDLEKAFNAAVEHIKTSNSGFKPSNDLKLQMYGLFKQATNGDVSGKKPGMLDMVGRAKYSAWEKNKGMSSADAMQAYLDVYESIKAEVED
jgi:acyl-CoA-binding protein